MILGGLRAVAALVFVFSFSHATTAEIRDVEFLSHGVTLSGSLVLPDGRPPIAALVLVHGSGPVDRMMRLARGLATDGFAVLTYDKRGVGRSGGVYSDEPGQAAAIANLLADDAVAGIDALSKDRRLDGVPMGFLGISQAGWIIPIAATKFRMTKFFGLWSGAVSTLSEQLHFQYWAGNDSDFWKTHTREQVTEYMKSVRYQADDVDPRNSLSALSIPGLWLYGSEDNLVPVDHSVDRLNSLIRQGHNNFQYRIVPGYGHRLVDTFNAPAYISMVEWIKGIVTTSPGSP